MDMDTSPIWRIAQSEKVRILGGKILKIAQSEKVRIFWGKIIQISKSEELRIVVDRLARGMR